MKKEAEKPSDTCANADISPELKEKVEALIKERAEAKREKNFARADEIRQELDGMGIVIKDTREGTVPFSSFSPREPFPSIREREFISALTPRPAAICSPSS